MGLFNKLFNKDQSAEKTPAQPNVPPEKKESAPVPKDKKPQVKKVKKSPKELATEKGEPYVSIESVELDPENIGNGAFELDWNEIFVAKLVRAGYKGKDDQQIVDQWFQDVCRNVVLETFEQYEANNPRPPSGIQRKDLGGGRSEVS
jgi:hypothetical protein